MDEYEEKILEYIDWVKPHLAQQLGWKIYLIDRDTPTRDATIVLLHFFWKEEENPKVLDYINKKLREDMLANAAEYKIWEEKGKRIESLEYLSEEDERYKEIVKTMQEIDFKLAYTYEDILVHPRLMSRSIFEFHFSSISLNVANWLLTQNIGTTILFADDDTSIDVYEDVTETGLILIKLENFGYEKTYGYINMEVKNGLPFKEIKKIPRDDVYGANPSHFHEWYTKQLKMEPPPEKIRAEITPRPLFYKMLRYPFDPLYKIDNFGQIDSRKEAFMDYRANPRKYIEKYTIEEEFGENQSSPRWKYLIERKKEADMRKELLKKGFEQYMQ